MISQHDFELCRTVFPGGWRAIPFSAHWRWEKWAKIIGPTSPCRWWIGGNHPHIAWTLSLFQVLDSNSSVMQFADFSDREGSDALDTITLTQFWAGLLLVATLQWIVFADGKIAAQCSISGVILVRLELSLGLYDPNISQYIHQLYIYINYIYTSTIYIHQLSTSTPMVRGYINCFVCGWRSGAGNGVDHCRAWRFSGMAHPSGRMPESCGKTYQSVLHYMGVSPIGWKVYNGNPC
jgi:hypothetical protein